MDKVYIVLFKDNTMELFPTMQQKNMFQKDARCFSCSSDTVIDEVREFVYTILPKYQEKWTEHGHAGKIFKREW